MVNTAGAYLTCRAFVPGMLAAGWGRIVSLSSAASLGAPGLLDSAYSTSKAALNRLTRHLAAELEGTGVAAAVIHPGSVKTEMWADIRTKVEGSTRNVTRFEPGSMSSNKREATRSRGAPISCWSSSTHVSKAKTGSSAGYGRARWPIPSW